ncbi:hypothetical protein M406DRAFT_330803 [Cryphonectria parasitica EP155]|uniref:AB hydrolase-1 domain-containing protein n=1 Tax=Cryphonectria parasitica (strain ATCC 38755 / EP155) TaxID=660469 RepID=A0A9P4XZZ9_CRYP1|nr:uncharacterized protein M406DRAFT_330803 [Cryphonectria parasitica EP155]KAF3764469.1 hypothetical protein M406DRAFT_330803 [Cryphonectria parasitica EP155]
MTQQRSDLAVVLCHGSYLTPAPYGPLLNALQEESIQAYCPQLPTCDLAKLNVGDIHNPDFDREPPAGGYPQGKEDAEAVLNVLEPLVDQGKRVLLIAHSSGGWTATQVARLELQAKSRALNGLAGGIIGILYMGAFFIPVGESVNSFFQPKDSQTPVTPPYMTFHKHGLSGLGTIVEAEKFLFTGLDQAQAKEWAAGLTASPILTTKLTNDAYSALPCAYLVLEYSPCKGLLITGGYCG